MVGGCPHRVFTGSQLDHQSRLAGTHGGRSRVPNLVDLDNDPVGRSSENFCP